MSLIHKNPANTPMKIKDDTQYNLGISEDTGEEDAPIAVLLFTPDMKNLMEHFHIELDVERSTKLYEWLRKFLGDKRKPVCEIEEFGLVPTPPIDCPCGCPKGVLRADGTNIDNTSTFLVCDACGCCYHADNINMTKIPNEDTMMVAPWTDEQVAALNEYQHSGRFHPFTGERYPDGSERILIATNLGWIGEEGGPVVQTWAWKFMAKTLSE